MVGVILGVFSVFGWLLWCELIFMVDGILVVVLVGFVGWYVGCLTCDVCFGIVFELFWVLVQEGSEIICYFVGLYVVLFFVVVVIVIVLWKVYWWLGFGILVLVVLVVVGIIWFVIELMQFLISGGLVWFYIFGVIVGLIGLVWFICVKWIE